MTEHIYDDSIECAFVNDTKRERIVRCRDCKYFKCLWIDGYVCTRNKEKLMPWVELNDFCAWGEGKVYDTGCEEGAIDVCTSW